MQLSRNTKLWFFLKPHKVSDFPSVGQAGRYAHDAIAKRLHTSLNATPARKEGFIEGWRKTNSHYHCGKCETFQRFHDLPSASGLTGRTGRR
jgi:hypothetical protein